MLELVRVFWDIALWRRGPRDVPPSWGLLLVVAALYVVTSVLQSLLMYGTDGALVRGCADLGLTTGLFWLCLAVGRRTHRLQQTLIALLGTGALLAVPMIGLQLIGQEAGPDGLVARLLTFVSLLLVIWYLLVIGHIVRLALEAPLFTGMAVAMTYFVLSYLVLVQLPAGSAG